MTERRRACVELSFPGADDRVAAPRAQDALTANQREANLIQLASTYAKNYAPYEWKRDVFGFDLYRLTSWLQRIHQSDDLDFQEALIEYLASLNDTHASIFFPSPFTASLGFTVDIYDPGKVLIDSVDRSPPAHRHNTLSEWETSWLRWMGKRCRASSHPPGGSRHSEAIRAAGTECLQPESFSGCSSYIPRASQVGDRHCGGIHPVREHGCVEELRIPMGQDRHRYRRRRTATQSAPRERTHLPGDGPRQARSDPSDWEQTGAASQAGFPLTDDTLPAYMDPI